MHKWVRQGGHDGSVDPYVITGDKEVDLLVGKARGLAHTALQSGLQASKGLLAGAHNLMLELLGIASLLADETVEQTDLLLQQQDHFPVVGNGFDKLVCAAMDIVISVHLQGIEFRIRGGHICLCHAATVDGIFQFKTPFLNMQIMVLQLA